MKSSPSKNIERSRPSTAGLFFVLFALVAPSAFAWPDLRIVKSGPAQAAPGDVITYTLSYTNKGPVKSTGVVMKDFLPSNTAVLTNTLNGGLLTNSIITWNLGSLNSGAGSSRSFQVLISTNVLAGSSLTNRSQIFGNEAEEAGKTNDNYSTFITGITGPLPDFCRAILAKQPISLHGNMVIDSFNSRDTSLSTNGRYDATKRGDAAAVASVSDSLTVITDSGNTKVYGRFETGPAGNVRITGNASVGSLAWVDGGNNGIEPGRYSTNLSAVIPDAFLPSVTFVTLPKTAGTVGGTNYNYVLTTGNYVRTTDLTLSGSEKMVINGNVVLHFQKKLTISGSAFIYITPGSKLTVYLADTTSLAAGGTVNGTGFGTNCAFVGLPTCTSISFGGNSEYIGTVYAPHATVQMTGAGAQNVSFVGAVVAKAVNISGTYQFHYDQGLCRECLSPTVSAAPVNSTNCPGTTASFNVTARGTDLRYAWFKGNTALVGETNSALVLTNLAQSDAGIYKVVVSVPCGDAVTNSATLTMNTSVVATSLINLSRFVGGSATFSTLASGTGPFSYVWRKNGAIIAGQANSSLTLSTIARSDAGIYAVTVSGNCGSVTQSATLTVLNSAPMALPDSYTVAEDGVLTIAVPGVLGNDSDADGDVLMAILVNGSANGTLTINPNGSFTYTPNANYSGPDSFTYRANDGTTNSGIVTVTLNVTALNDAPVALPDSYTVTEDGVLTIVAPGVLGNDSDADGDTLTAILVNGPANGTLTINPNGSFTYTPNANYNGPDSFTYRANDGTTNSGIVTVTLNVTAANDAPVALPDSYTVTEDGVLTIAAPGVLGNDSDADGDTLTAILVNGPANGTLTINPNGSFTYTPNANYSGPDSFTYRANDGTTNSGIVTVTLNVTAMNDAPVGLPDSYTVTEDGVLTIVAPGVLGNDSDADGDVLTAILVNGPANGTLTLNPNGSFTYTPNANYNGPDSFTYRANDGTTNSGIVTVTLNVTAANDAPVAQPDSYTVTEDESLTIAAPGVLGNDSDADGDVLTAILVNGPANGTLTLNPNGSFTYTPNANYNGPDSFTYRANDGTTNSGIVTVTLNVTAANDAPVGLPDSYTVTEDGVLTIAAPGVLGNDSDADGDTLTAILVNGPANGTLTINPNGSFTYTPNANYNGLDSFTYRANDGTINSGIVTVTLNVMPVNNPPDTNNWAGSTYSTREDVMLTVTVPGLLAGIVDVDGDILTILPVTGTSHGELNLGTNGAFTYLPNANFNGADSFQFMVSDGATNSGPLTASITVVPVNDPPSFVSGGSLRIQKNAGLQVVPAWASNITPGPTNESSQLVTFQVTNNNTALFSTQPAVSADGTLTYVVASNMTGTAVVTLIARDNGGNANGGVDTSSPQIVSLTVNAPPTVQITSPTNGASFFVPANFTVLANAQDADGSIAKVEFFSGTNKVGEAVSGAPYFTVLTNLPVGSYVLTAVATDDFGATGSATPLTVAVLERPPLTLLTSVYYNPQKDFFEQRVRVMNPTYSTLDAVRVLVSNLTNVPAITVGNASGFTNGIPYVQSYAAVPPGGYIDLTIEYLSPLRRLPNPILRAELVRPSVPAALLSGTFQRINRGLMLANRTFMVEFATVTNRVYAIQYSGDLLQWKNAQSPVPGTGNWAQWIDNGLPKTEVPPGDAPTRYYRVIQLP